MSKKICRGSTESEDVAHFAILHFMEHERGQEIVDSGKAMNFISGIIHRSFHSSTSQYHTVYRQKGRVHQLKDGYEETYIEEEYDYHRDEVMQAVEGIMEDMGADRSELWYRCQLFKMWIVTPNYSELYRRTGIPRTSISLAVEEAKAYIRTELKKRNINYDI